MLIAFCQSVCHFLGSFIWCKCWKDGNVILYCGHLATPKDVSNASLLSLSRPLRRNALSKGWPGWQAHLSVLISRWSRRDMTSLIVPHLMTLENSFCSGSHRSISYIHEMITRNRNGVFRDLNLCLIPKITHTQIANGRTWFEKLSKSLLHLFSYIFDTDKNGFKASTVSLRVKFNRVVRGRKCWFECFSWYRL